MKALILFLGATTLALGATVFDTGRFTISSALGAIQFGLLCAVAFRVFMLGGVEERADA